MMTRIIAIANDKGGVAKTTTAISLAGAMVEKGQEVLIVDMDSQASASIALGVSPHLVTDCITDCLINTNSAENLIRETALSGLDIIPSKSEMILAERYLPIHNNYKRLLRNELRQIKQYDTIILDCPPSLGAITQSALVAADLLIIPIIP